MEEQAQSKCKMVEDSHSLHPRYCVVIFLSRPWTTSVWLLAKETSTLWVGSTHKKTPLWWKDVWKERTYGSNWTPNTIVPKYAILQNECRSQLCDALFKDRNDRYVKQQKAMFWAVRMKAWHLDWYCTATAGVRMESGSTTFSGMWQGGQGSSKLRQTLQRCAHICGTKLSPAQSCPDFITSHSLIPSDAALLPLHTQMPHLPLVVCASYTLWLPCLSE